LSGSELRLYGTVGDDYDGFTDETVVELLDQTDGPLTIRLNSPGGYVYQGIAVHTHLASRDVTVIIDGLAASIASIIAMAGKRVLIASGAMMMIHNPWNIAMGDSAELRKSADTLDQIRESLLDIYQKRTGLSRQRISAMLDEETWLSADEAIALGFADAMLETETPINLAGLNLGILPNVPAALKGHKTMQTEKTPSRREKAAAKAADAQAQATAIRKMVQAAGHGDDFAERLIDQGEDIAGAQAAIDNLTDYLRQSRSSQINGLLSSNAMFSTSTEYGGHGAESFAQAASDAICKRATGKGKADPELVRMSLMDIAHHCVEHSGARRPWSSRPSELVKAALSTSDFPHILEDALRKSIRSGMEQESATHRDWIRVSEAQDFRSQKRPLLSSAPDLDEVLEGAEYQYGSFSDDGTEFTVHKFGKIVSLSFEAMVNDDLGAFSRLAPALGLAAIRKEADQIYSLLTSNAAAGPTMQDGTALFHADHGNIITGSSLGVASLSQARTALRRQKDISGRGWLNLTPRHLIVPPELEQEALQLVRASSIEAANYNGQESGTDPIEVTGTREAINAGPPAWISNMRVVVEPRLELVNTFYIAAPFSEVDHFELAHLAESPEIRSEDGFEVDALKWRIRHVFGTGCLDWRGLVRVSIS
jgi:ATP-dependent protease ClpP protease subunit/phage major head subunit gpT-like protein